MTGHELLTTEEMARADAMTAASGSFTGYALMRNAAQAIHNVLLERWPEAARVAVLCGPGNNGGDGYALARLLHEDGVAVTVFAEGPPRPASDAALAAADCPVGPEPLASFDPSGFDLVVDALFGAGLARALEGRALAAARKCHLAAIPVLAVDVPSGLSGDSGQPMGEAFRADCTVTFFRFKPGHWLEPGRTRCGRTILADIGIQESVLDGIAPQAWVNGPRLWTDLLPGHGRLTHKYARGAAAVFSGGVASTGAARLAALSAARIGAGAVTVLSPPAALMVNACHLTSVMLRPVGGADDALTFLAEGKTAAALVGPGYGVGDSLKAMVRGLLAVRPGETGKGLKALVLDADALTTFAQRPEPLFDAVKASPLAVAMTPHAGEFARLFPRIDVDRTLSKLDKARLAAALSGAVVAFKGPDTVIAAPDGRAAINGNATPALATAGSGDVLAGIATGLLAQGMPAFEAMAAAVWLHGVAGGAAGPRPIAEDMLEALKWIEWPGAASGQVAST